MDQQYNKYINLLLLFTRLLNPTNHTLLLQIQ